MKNAMMSRVKLAPKKKVYVTHSNYASQFVNKKIERAPTIEPKDVIRKTILNTECVNWPDLGTENIIYEVEFNFNYSPGIFWTKLHGK